MLCAEGFKIFYPTCLNIQLTNKYYTSIYFNTIQNRFRRVYVKKSKIAVVPQLNLLKQFFAEMRFNIKTMTVTFYIITIYIIPQMTQIILIRILRKIHRMKKKRQKHIKD